MIFLCLEQIYTDFDEIRQEIEAETERVSGNNKVRLFTASLSLAHPDIDRNGCNINRDKNPVLTSVGMWNILRTH